MNSMADDCSTMPNPSMAAADSRNRPVTLPRVDGTTARRPPAAPLRMASMVAGPGLTTLTAATNE